MESAHAQATLSVLESLLLHLLESGTLDRDELLLCIDSAQESSEITSNSSFSTKNEREIHRLTSKILKNVSISIQKTGRH